MDLTTAKAHLAREIERARRALAVERAWPLAAPSLIAAALWACVGLYGLLDRIHPLVATLAVIAALGGVAWLAVRGLRRWRRPTASEARVRLERDAALDLGSLSAADDRPASLNPDALALWRREQDRAAARIAEARAKRARPRFDAADPLRLRYVAALALVGGVTVAGFESPDRLARAFVPDPGPLLGDGPLLIEAWATPAAYTGAGPIPLSDREGERIVTPPRLEATVRVSGAAGAPRLVYATGRGDRAVRFARTADGAWEAKMPVDQAGELRVVRFHTKARWRLAPAADAAPAARFLNAPQWDGGALVFSWEAADDYGVREVALELTPVDPPIGLKGAPPSRVPLESPPGDPASARGEAEIEMAAHPYAGLKVSARIVARDAVGQSGAGPAEPLSLPPPTFLQPLARAAIEIRRAVAWERRPYREPGMFAAFARASSDPLSRAPDGVRRAASLLDGLMVAPEDGAFADLAVYAGLAAARAVLGQAGAIDGTDDAADILWHTAMRAEFGASADARAALEQAQKALAEAIANGAGKDEIDRLSDAVRRAMKQYLDALVAEAMRDGKTAQSQEDSETQAALGRDDLDALLDQVKRLVEEGRTEEAMALLSQIAGLLDNLEVRLVEGQGDGQGGPGQGDPKLNEAIQGLSGAMGEQRSLRDETDDAMRSGRQGRGGEGDLARRQEDLAGRLGEARRRLGEAGGGDEQRRRAAGEAGRAVDEAEGAMREAGDALRRGDLETARRRQDEALSALRNGADALGQEQLRRERADGQGRPGREGGARDPLGRALEGGVGDGGEVGVPDRIEGERAREIRDELRRRAEDPRRPQEERDYLRRLLERFEGA